MTQNEALLYILRTNNPAPIPMKLLDKLITKGFVKVEEDRVLLTKRGYRAIPTYRH